MNLVDHYLEGLRQAMPPEPLAELALASGASAAQLDSLRQAYPLCPDSLLRLLGQYNGTYYQDYAGGRVLVYMLGSDVFEYPYYLSSVERILKDGQANQRSIAEIYGHYLEEDPGMVDARIDAGIKQGQRLCFSHCMNNGGSSRLYVDFTPAASGKVGQVVRFLHDPDNYLVIADSFDAYLHMLIDDGYAFLSDDNVE